MTYMFELDFPKVEAGTEEEDEQVKKFKGVSRRPFPCAKVLGV
jgi:hypothetical protein